MKVCSSVIMCSSLKEERLGSLRQRLAIQFDGSCLDHQVPLYIDYDYFFIFFHRTLYLQPFVKDHQAPLQTDRFMLQDALRHLWRVAYPNREIPPLKSELWKEMGWQGCDPSTDFR